MRLGDILSKLGRGEPLSGAEIETLRMLGNTLQNLIAFAMRVNPQSGDITELRAGDVELLPTGLYAGGRAVHIDQNGITLDGAAAAEWSAPATIKWKNFTNGYTLVETIGREVLGANPHYWIDVNRNGDYAASNYVLQVRGINESAQLRTIDLGLAAGPTRTLSSTASGTEFFRITSDTSGGTGGALGEIAFNRNAADIDFRIGSDNNANMVHVDAGNDRVGIGTATPNQPLTVEGTMSLKEQASANADTVAYGQLWVKTADPCELWFTDDAGTDTKLA